MGHVCRARIGVVAVVALLLATMTGCSRHDDSTQPSPDAAQHAVALLDALVSPHHDLSLARALKSPLFGLDDAALVALRLRGAERALSWFDRLQLDWPADSPLAGLGAWLTGSGLVVLSLIAAGLGLVACGIHHRRAKVVCSNTKILNEGLKP